MPFERFPVEKPVVLKASTPGGHPVIRAVWLGGFFLLALAALMFEIGAFSYPIPAVTGLAWIVAGLVAYGARHARFAGTLARRERALRTGDLPAARAIVAPLVDRFPNIPAVQRVAGLVLYASGDPLSAAAMLESAARVSPDSDVAVTLTASYAALNKAGDARRAAALRPDDPDVRLALTWAELVAPGGDPPQG